MLKVSFKAIFANVQNFLPNISWTEKTKNITLVNYQMSFKNRYRCTLPTTKSKINSSMYDGPLPRWWSCRSLKFLFIDSDPKSSINWVSALCEASTNKPVNENYSRKMQFFLKPILKRRNIFLLLRILHSMYVSSLNFNNFWFDLYLLLQSTQYSITVLNKNEILLF